MQRPLVPVALLFTGGILLARWFHPPLAVLFALGYLAGLAALMLARSRIYLLTVLLVLAGWTDLSWHTAILSPNDLRRIIGPGPANAVVRGALHESPMPRIFEKQGREWWRSVVVIDAEAVQLQGRWQPAFGKVTATVPGILPTNFFSGQVVEVAGALAPPRGPLAEGLFDPRSHYQNLGIYYQLRTTSMNDWELAPADFPRHVPLGDRFSAWARPALAMGLGQDDAPLRLIWTLALDWKAPLTETVEEPFMRAGTYHIFAVDGLRIGLLAGIGIGLLRVLQLPRGLCGLLVIPGIWFYASLTGWPPSAVRAAVMMTIVIVGWVTRRPVDLVNSLFAAAFVILLWDPAQLFQAGFQLSFLVVLAIALLLPPIRKLFQSWIFRKDPFLPEALRPRWPQPLAFAVNFVIDTCAVSLAAWLGSIPLAAAYFHLFTPASVPANVLVVPITALALMSSIGSLLTAAWLPGLAVLFNHSAWFFMSCITVLSHWAARWPYGAWYVATPSAAAFAMYYIILFSALTGWLFRSVIKWPVVALVVGLGFCWLTQRAAESKTARLHVLPLDGGAAIFADNAGGDNFLFDCGNASKAETIVKPFLAAHGINTLDAFALTVGHTPDGGGANVILTNFAARRVLLNPMPERSSAYHDVIDDVKRTAPWRTAQAGDEINGWSVLYPVSGPAFDNADDNAMVFRREIRGHSILLLSSLGRAGQNLLAQNHPDLRAEIVVTGLPDRDEPLCEPLLRLIQPRLIIIVDSSFPAMRRAPAKLRERLATHSIPVVYCRDSGAVKLNLWPGGWNAQQTDGKIVSP